METFHPGVHSNTLQLILIGRMADRMGAVTQQAREEVTRHWVDEYSPRFREIWNTGERNPDTIAEQLYQVDGLTTNYQVMVAAILIHTPDPCITE